MTPDDDEIRDALEQMSAMPPVAPGRVDAVHRRARRIRQRRAVVAAALSVALVGAGVGIAVPLLQSSSSSHSSRLIQGEPGGSEASEPTAPDTATPTPSALPLPSRSPIAVPQPTVAVPITHNPPTAEHVSVDVTSQTDPNSPAGYPRTLFHVHVTGHVFGTAHVVAIYYDDNTSRLDQDSTRPACVHDYRMRSVDATYTFSFMYRNAGIYHVHGIVQTGTCSDVFNDTYQHDWETHINVPVSSTHSNGITQPTLTLTGSTPSGNVLDLGVRAYDFDGWIQSIKVDWGDGSQPLVSTYPNCNDWSGTTWPYGYQDRSYNSPGLSPGSYTVTVTVTTGGCDGKDLQTVMKSWTATVS